jgi:hypothetical protein
MHRAHVFIIQRVVEVYFGFSIVIKTYFLQRVIGVIVQESREGLAAVKVSSRTVDL